MKKQQIQLFKKQVKKLDAEDFDLEAWKVSTQLLLGQAFGKYDEKTIAIRDLKIDYSSTMLRDSNSNYKPMETCKRKGREILELAIDELEMSVIPESELANIVKTGDKDALLDYLKKRKKEELVDLLLQVMSK